MSELFAVPALAYDRLMGRYLPSLGVAFADAARVAAGQRVLDVGCGPGGLTTILADRVGASGVAAIDPSPPFVAACRDRLPGVDVRQGFAEQLPFDDQSFDVCLASLVVGFMQDPQAGVQEMRRVTRAGGRVAVSFWDLDRMPLLQTFWRAVASVRPENTGEAYRLGPHEGDLESLLGQAGLTDVSSTVLAATGHYADLDDWWSSFTGGAGPAGSFVLTLTPPEQTAVRERCGELLEDPEGPFSLTAYAWCAVGTVTSAAETSARTA